MSEVLVRPGYCAIWRCDKPSEGPECAEHAAIPLLSRPPEDPNHCGSPVGKYALPCVLPRGHKSHCVNTVQRAEKREHDRERYAIDPLLRERTRLRLLGTNRVKLADPAVREMYNVRRRELRALKRSPEEIPRRRNFRHETPT